MARSKQVVHVDGELELTVAFTHSDVVKIVSDEYSADIGPGDEATLVLRAADPATGGIVDQDDPLSPPGNGGIAAYKYVDRPGAGTDAKERRKR